MASNPAKGPSGAYAKTGYLNTARVAVAGSTHRRLPPYERNINMQGSNTGVRGFPYDTYQAGYPPPRPTAANPTFMNNSGQYATPIPGRLLVQMPMPTGRALNQHPGAASYGTPALPLTRPSGVQAQAPFHHQGVQLHAGHVNGSHQGAAVGYSNLRHETPANFTHGAYQAVNHQALRTPHTGQPHACIHGHIAVTPAGHRHVPPCQPPPNFQPPAPTRIPNAHLHPNPPMGPPTLPMGPPTLPMGPPTLPMGPAYTRQPNLQPAVPPQESPPPYSETALSPSSTASVQSPSSFGDAPSPTAPSLPLKEKRQRGTSPPTEVSCPFPNCKAKPSRKQELERHVGQHLPNYLFCTQQNCHFTADRKYALTNHYKTKHPDVPFVQSEGFKIYDAKTLVKQLLNKEITLEQAESEAQTAFRKRGVELGKVGLWRQ